MVSDRTTVLSRYFGVLNEKTGNSERWTFIVDPDGVLKTVEIHTEPLGRSANELVRKLNALRFIRQNPGNACVASWNGENSPKLQPSIKIAGEVAENLS
jgi:peroxiredoxin (alkyl hydroperoxide reductase subunit C)